MNQSTETTSNLEAQVLALKKALSELQEENQKLIIEAQNSAKGLTGSWEMDLQTQKVTWSEEMFILLNVNRTIEPNMKLFNEKLPPVCKNKLLGAINKIFVTGKDYTFEHFIQLEDAYKNALSELYPVLNDNGQPIRLIGKLTDTTAIKTSQKEIEKLSVIAAHTSNAVITMDKETKIDWVNNAFTYMTGYRLDEQSGKLFDDLIKTKPSEVSCKEIFEKSFISENKFVIEAQLISKKGNLIWVVISVSPIMDYELNPKSYVAIITDISERKKAEDELARRHKAITDSISYAERIQRSFLATKELLQDNLNDYFIIFKPKDVVSGDFYWASKLPNGNFAFVTADSTGHGVPGAIMSLLNITSLEKAVEIYYQASAILNMTREIIIERLKKDGSTTGGKDGMDCSLTVYDFKNNKLTIASANNPVWIVRGSETIEIKPDKMPVGKHDKQEDSFTQQEINIQKGDVIYTLTDGFQDQFGGPSGKKFMSKNLRELLSKNAHLPMHEQKVILEATFKEWVGDLEQVDDITLIGIRI